MKGFCHYLYYWLGLIYDQNFNNSHPNRGDAIDMYHAIYAGYSDVFVSNDSSLRKYLEYIPCNKHQYLSLDKFFVYKEIVRKDNDASKTF